MIQNSTPQRNHYSRFPYLLHMQTNKRQQSKSNSSPEFNFNICAENPCNNQTSSFELSTNDNIQQQIRKRKPLKIELQSINFQSFKRKVRQTSFPHSFIAYTPSKQSQDQQFKISHQSFTDPKANDNQINIDEFPFDTNKQLFYSDNRVLNQEFIRLEISESIESEVIQTEAKISKATTLEFPTLQSTMKSFTSNNKNALQETIVTLKTKEMSSRLSENNQFKYYHSISCTPNSVHKLTQDTTQTRSTIKLKGRTTKKHYNN